MSGGRATDFFPGMVSVIVASYNHAEYLIRRMDSLVSQTYGNMEIIVIDDCSQDDSPQVLQRYASDPRVRIVINERNSGWVGVSNTGVALARGEYVIFANCDDYSNPCQMERLVAQFEKYPDACVSFSKSYLVDERDAIFGNDYSQREPAFRKYCSCDTLIPKDIMARFLMHSCVIPNLSAALIRKSAFLEASGFSPDYKVVSDWDLFFKLCRLGETAWVAEPLNFFRQHGSTIRATTKERRTYEEIFNLLFGEMDKWGFAENEKSRFKGFMAEIWVDYFFRSPKSAIGNFGYHFALAERHNPGIWPYLFRELMLFPFKKISRRMR